LLEVGHKTTQGRGLLGCYTV